MTRELSRHELLEIASSVRSPKACSNCAALSCPGWISVPGYFDLGTLRVLGTLKVDSLEEHWDEYHPDGTNLWSLNAPISVQHHPYNRSDIRECMSCKRKFMHYTEYGGYYLDERIRELNAQFIV